LVREGADTEGGLYVVQLIIQYKLGAFWHTDTVHVRRGGV